MYGRRILIVRQNTSPGGIRKQACIMHNACHDISRTHLQKETIITKRRRVVRKADSVMTVTTVPSLTRMYALLSVKGASNTCRSFLVSFILLIRK